jgi:hypothetical protein
VRASYRRGSGRKRPGIYSNWKGEGNGELGLSHRRKKRLGREMTGGSHLSAVEEGKKRTVSGFS